MHLPKIAIAASATEYANAKTVEDENHGKVGIVMGIVGFANKGLGVAYFVSDYAIQHVTYTDPSNGQYYQGWSAAALSMPPVDLGSQPYPGNH